MHRLNRTLLGVAAVLTLAIAPQSSAAAPPEPFYTDMYLGFGWPSGDPALEVNWKPLSLAVDSFGRILTTGWVGRREILARFVLGGSSEWVAGTFDGRDIEDDGGLALDADLFSPDGIAVGPAGEIVTCDVLHRVIRRIDPDGRIHTIAGRWGEPGTTQAGQPALGSPLFYPTRPAFGPDGTLYFSEGRIWRISNAGILEVVVGNGAAPADTNFVNGALATATPVSATEMGFDGLGRLYFVDRRLDASRGVRRVELDGTLRSVAGTLGTRGDRTGDGGPATEALLGRPSGIAVAANGSFFIGDASNGVVRYVDTAGIISTVAGTGNPGFNGEGLPATASQLGPVDDLALLPDGRLLIADPDNNRIRMIDFDGTLKTVVGNGTQLWGGDGRLRRDAATGGVSLTFASDGTAYLADGFRIRKIAPDGTVSTIAGNGGSADGPDGLPALESEITATWIDLHPSGEIYFMSQRLRKITGAGLVAAVAGTDVPGLSGDGGDARLAKLNRPQDFEIAPDGRIFIADRDNGRVRMVDTDGVIHTFAGTVPGLAAGDGGLATDAILNRPTALALGADGSVYVTGADRIRKITPDGMIQTVVGGNGVGFSGDGGLAILAQLNSPEGIYVDAVGGLYLCDMFNDRVRYVDSSGIIHTVAGNGQRVYNGARGKALEISFLTPQQITGDPSGNLYVSQWSTNLLRRLRPASEVAVAFHSLRAEFVGSSVLLHWRAERVEGLEFRVLRRGDGSSDWLEIGRAFAGAAGDVSYLDASSGRGAAEGTVSYAISVFDPATRREISRLGPIALSAASAVAFRGSVYPNPARGSSEFYFNGPTGLRATAEIYDVRGRRVRSLGALSAESGEARLSWAGVDDHGRTVSRGSYYVLVRSEGGQILWQKKFSLMR